MISAVSRFYRKIFRFQDLNLGDIFGDIFGFSQRGGRTRVKRGRDISIDLEISFEEAAFGVERKLF